MNELPPIPIPREQRWRDFRGQYLPSLVFAMALMAAIFIWTRHVSPATLIGQVEPVLASVSSPQAGTLVQLNLGLFQEVKAGDIVAHVITTDPRILAASLAVIQAETELIRKDLSPVMGQQRYAVSFDRLELDWLRERVDLATSKVKFQQAETEFRRAGELFKEQIASASEYEMAKNLRDSLEVEVNERSKLVGDLETKLADLRGDPTNKAARDPESIVGGGMKAAINLQSEKLRLTEAQMSPVLLRAPISGQVTTIFKRAGEAIVPGEPILAVNATQSDKIVGYMVQPLSMQPIKGMQVRVRTRRPSRQEGIGQILAVGAAMQPIPTNLLRPGVNFETGLPITVSLPENLQATPGEAVELTFLDR